MLTDKRILVTHAERFMGPALVDEFRRQGATVIADNNDLQTSDAVKKVINEAGDIDVLVVNLAITAPATRLTEVDSDEWKSVFAALVDPLPRLFKAVLPAMIERQRGKILLMGSAAALRGMKRTSTYSAARGAQLAYMQAAAIEMAPHYIQINAIAQNFVDNPTYFPAEVQSDPRFQARLKREVPLGRLVSAAEDAAFAAYLCSDKADCFVAQVFPVTGGWINR
ncbi:SDR family oxidoreductase [Pseudidiomarina sp.]|uniref:SDR family oxidoreductase n=1 Tax=Pseudidiomarina sp. TaxID=2081707 RepID=UPI00299D7ED1|nr:SDR family oxidoreductase [Pseudidiomarina sp.]MDX1705674.1 SDR family oxidoreductase [Pseudidiomarina sp.]